MDFKKMELRWSKISHTVVDDPDVPNHSIIIEAFEPPIRPKREYKPIPNAIVDEVYHDLKHGSKDDLRRIQLQYSDKAPDVFANVQFGPGNEHNRDLN